MSEDRGAVLSVENLSKSFIDDRGISQTVIDGLTLALSRNTITTILGASGCGKTTLLRLLAGLEVVDKGSIKSDLRRPGREIGYLQQSERLLPWRTVLENVGLGLELLGSDKKAALAAAQPVLADVGMFEFASTNPSKLSGGMTQRVLLARTLITKPSLLLLDEPLGQLDLVARKDLAKIIRLYVQKNNAAALLVTHSVEEAVFISDVVLTLSKHPSKIVERFTLHDDCNGNHANSVKRRDSFEPIQQSLLDALAGSQPINGSV